MNRLLLVIDLQNGFLNPETQDLTDKINDLIESNKYDKVLFTRFINEPDSIWVRKIKYTGCISEEEKALAIDSKNCDIMDKYMYTAFNENLERYIKENEVGEIYVCGIDTECCVLTTVLDLFQNDYDVYVLRDYCRCTHGKIENEQALEVIGRNIGINRII